MCVNAYVNDAIHHEYTLFVMNQGSHLRCGHLHTTSKDVCESVEGKAICFTMMFGGFVDGIRWKVCRAQVSVDAPVAVCEKYSSYVSPR